MGGKTLTAREAEIANFVVQGRTNAEIAAEMFIAEITVKKGFAGDLPQIRRRYASGAGNGPECR